MVLELAVALFYATALTWDLTVGLWSGACSFGRDYHSMKVRRGSAMAMLHRVFPADQLKDLDLKGLEILKSAIADTLRTDDDIRDILRRRLQDVFNSLKPPPSTQAPPPP